MLRPLDLLRDALCLVALVPVFALLGAYALAAEACRELRRLAR